MKISIIILGLIVFALGIYFMTDRESKVFRKVTTIISPLISAPPEKQAMTSSYSGSVSKLIEGDVWNWYLPELVESNTKGDVLQVTSKKESVWWKNWRGPAIFTEVDGDVDISMVVKTFSSKDGRPPLDSGYQFAGLMLRDPKGDKYLTSENYVFNVLGHRGANGMQIETKSTVDGWSYVEGFDWNGSEAELRLQRVNNMFKLFARPTADSNWQLMNQYERTDLPARLQLGVIMYAFDYWSGDHDLASEFGKIDIKL